jgi:hypothetical protein
MVKRKKGLETEHTHLAVVRSPVSSLATAEACPSVIVMGFPPGTAKQKTQKPPVSIIWSLPEFHNPD